MLFVVFHVSYGINGDKRAYNRNDKAHDHRQMVNIKGGDNLQWRMWCLGELKNCQGNACGQGQNYGEDIVSRYTSLGKVPDSDEEEVSQYGIIKN